MIKTIFTAIFFILFSNQSYANLIDQKHHRKIANIALMNFWGNAKSIDGSFIQPKSEKERNTIPISDEDISRVIEVAEISSILDHCKLDWENNYHKATNGARTSKLTDTQVAFVGMLHGIAMGMIDSSLKDKECSENLKNYAIKNSSGDLINFSSSKKLK